MKKKYSSPDSSPDPSSSSADEFRVKQRHLESRIFYTDYDITAQKKLTTLAKDAVRTVAEKEKGVGQEDVFFHEVANVMKDSLLTPQPSGEEVGKKKWHVIVGNDFGAQGDAVKGTIAFFAIGDVKFLVFRSK
uniref:Dynein light chain n=1 Tax=Caenorhabditis japonica TaxID=281687 RepID=A0A8R1HJ68_CAEJA